MEQFTVDEFQRNFDALFERVENGESFKITSEDGKAVVIVPIVSEATESDWEDFWYNEQSLCDI
jgi:antitoxin (DNA-binding transcriptional repressor) of toxin-antitoxin stability system|tara:strand:- start:11938 stop:12129 length:192 start_codon:yes stop_codon:yes gene_type:complete